MVSLCTRRGTFCCASATTSDSSGQRATVPLVERCSRERERDVEVISCPTWSYSQVIPAFEMVMRARANVYHLECFACQQCGHRFCVGDQFYLHDNQVTNNHRIFVKLNNLLFQVLCGPDYEERMVFASLSSHPQHLAQLRQSSQENSPHQHQSQNSSGHPPTQLRRGSSLKSSTPSLSSSSSPSSLVPMPLPPIQTM